MPSQLKLDQVEKALVALLAAAMGSLAKDVAGVTVADLDQDGALITIPPAVRVVFDGEQPAPARDHLRLTYQVPQSYLVMCGALNLRSHEDERRDAYSMVNAVRDAVAGARLQLEDGTTTEPCLLGPTRIYRLTRNGVWYQTTVVTGGVAQFTAK